MQSSNRKGSKGFTLIELLVVISIIGILASTVLVATQRTRFRAKAEVMKKEFQQLVIATQLYFDNNGNRWGGDVQTTTGICPTTGNTIFANDEIKKLLTSIAAIFPGSTIECMATRDTPPYTAPPAVYWFVHLTATGPTGTNKWCLDNYDIALNGVSSNGMLKTNQGSFNRTLYFASGVPVVIYCGDTGTPGSPEFNSPDW